LGWIKGKHYFGSENKSAAIGAPETVRHSRQRDSDFEAEKRRWATGARIWRD